VVELAHQVIAPRNRAPAKQEIGEHLHGALALYRPLSLVLGRAAVFVVTFVSRRLFFLDLQEQRIVGMPADQQYHVVTRAYAARPHHFESDINRLVAVEDELMVGRKRVAVLGKRIHDRLLLGAGNFPDRTWLGGKTIRVSGTPARKLLEIAQRSRALRFFERAADHGVPLATPSPVARHLERRRFRKFVNPPRILFQKEARGVFAPTLAVTADTASQHDAGGTALDVPLPRPALRLIKIVDVQDHVGGRRGIETEVLKMSVTTQL